MEPLKIREWIHPAFLEVTARSPESGGSWSPRWRGDIAKRYVVEARKAQVEKRSWSFPAHERDPFIGGLFVGSFYGPENCVSSELLWALLTETFNDTLGHGSRIKAMTIAGLSPAQISGFVMGTPECVMTYQACFFDVTKVIGNEVFMSSIVFPFKTQDYDHLDEETKRERFWMTVAFLRKWEGLRTVLEKPMSNDKGVVEEQIALMRAAMTSQALEYAMNARSFSMPRPVDFERFIALRTSQAAVDQANTTSGNDQAANFVNMLHDVLQGRAARGKLSSDRAEELRQISNGPIIEAEVRPIGPAMRSLPPKPASSKPKAPAPKVQSGRRPLGPLSSNQSI